MTGLNDAALAEALDVQLRRAEEVCAQRGGRLTDIRRQVLTHILQSREPIGAYALLDLLRDQRARAAPPTVYRALDFLLDHGLIHRIERLNAFMGCCDGGTHRHAAQFLICRGCGAVTEVDDHGITEAVATAAAGSGFQPTRVTVEIEGMCGACG